MYMSEAESQARQFLTAQCAVLPILKNFWWQLLRKGRISTCSLVTYKLKLIRTWQICQISVSFSLGLVLT